MAADRDDDLQAGVAHHQAGRLAEAMAVYRRVVRDRPGEAAAWHLMGVASQQTGDFAGAVEYLKKAMKLGGATAKLHQGLGAALDGMKRHEEAVREHRAAMRLEPGVASAHNNLGAALQNLGRIDEAIESYQRAVKIQGEYVGAMLNLAGALLLKGERGRAEEWFAKAAKVDGKNVRARLGVGTMMLERGANAEAIREFDAVLKVEAGNVDAKVGKAVAMVNQGRWREAVGELDAAVAGRPGDGGLAVRRAVALPVIAESVAEIEECRERLGKQIVELREAWVSLTDPVREVGATLFYLVYQGRDDRKIQEDLAGFYRGACPGLNFVAPHMEGEERAKAREEIVRGKRKIKLGIASAYLNGHTIGLFMAGLVEHLDREKFHVTVFRPGDKKDSVREWIDRSADEVADLPGELGAARGAIAVRELDVLMYPEIGMDVLTYFLSFSRLARVQCVWWGHPVTTGVSTVDYYVSCEDLEPPEGEKHYSEKLVRLATPAMYPDKPVVEGDGMEVRRAAGLEGDCHVYLCPQSLFKFHPEFDGLLRGVLEADERGRVVVFEGRDANWRRLLEGRMARSMGKLAERVVFLPRQGLQSYLKWVKSADVMLDTPHFSGGNTTYQALGLGTPVVTLPGGLMRGRITYACYKQIGVMDCVAKDQEEYVRLAVKLAGDKEYRTSMSEKIMAANEVLFRNIKAVREMEGVLERAVRG